jgi:hypothetical protein
MNHKAQNIKKSTTGLSKKSYLLKIDGCHTDESSNTFSELKMGHSPSTYICMYVSMYTHIHVHRYICHDLSYLSNMLLLALYLSNTLLLAFSKWFWAGLWESESEGTVGGVESELVKMYWLRRQFKILTRHSKFRALIATITTRLILKNRL